MDMQPEKESLFIIKIGGNVIDEEKSLNKFLDDFAFLKSKKILVHGGGKVATSIGEKLGITSNYVEGRRITDGDTIDLVTMVYGGLVNKKIVALLQSKNTNAIGLTGADANMIPAQKRLVKKIDFGWVGDVDQQDLNSSQWKLFLDNGMVPVVAPLTHDGAGNMLNTNADTIASVLATGLSEYYSVKLIFCFEKDGVLSDIQKDDSVIRNLDESTYQQLKKEKKLFAGILPKIDNAFAAINHGVEQVIIGNSSKLIELSKGESGTIMK
ncbi:MAG: acetylglutamate kinase [Ginsengibacter sp.]